MNQRLAAAEAALKANEGAAAIEHLVAALEEDPAQTAQVYRVLLIQFFRAARHAEAEPWTARAVQRFPKDAGLWNLRGVTLRNLKRYPEALTALDTAVKLAPKDMSILINRGNVLADLGDGVRAEQVFTKLARADPRNSEHHRQLGRALVKQGKRDQALSRFKQAVAVKRDNIEAWLDLLGQFLERHDADGAFDIVEKALAANPDNPRLLESKVVIFRRSGQVRLADTYLTDLVATHPDVAWVHYQLGGAVSDYDRERANVHLRRAVELEPDKLDYRMSLIESLERTRTGDEGANIEEAYQLATVAVARHLAELSPSHLKIAYEVFVRVGAFDEMDLLGDLSSLGRVWAEAGKHTALLKLLAQVKSLDDRYELLEQHRIWGRQAERDAALHPIRKPEPRPAGGKIRLGFMSSDLRRHPVGYFALPLFEHVDTERFEVFCYSFYQNEKADPFQDFFAERSTYRWKPDITTRDAAQMIADDQIDMLIELGGTTHMNKLDVMAYKPARLQASWLGYPHSAGLSTIDYLICDPHNTPPRRDLLVEQPLMMPKTWIALGKQIFSAGHLIEPGLPQDRAGRITFGTANNPHKYNREMLALWSQVLLAVPGSRFMFIRPEGGTASFRANLHAQFASHGVDPERIVFNTIRGAHMPMYNQLDISLDTLPLTGGTTTTESLWMGVPVVSLIGETFFERLSGSIMANSNVGDLATTDPAKFVQIAVDLANDRARRADLRANLRTWMSEGPLGQTEQFAADFYDLIARTVRPEG
jgi:protein O-GlcNAc transferase